MSDAQQPPPLRLRPKLPSSEPAAASPAPKPAEAGAHPEPPSAPPPGIPPASESEATASAAQGQADGLPMKLKLKPKLIPPTAAEEPSVTQPLPTSQPVTAPAPVPLAAAPGIPPKAAPVEPPARPVEPPPPAPSAPQAEPPAGAPARPAVTLPPVIQASEHAPAEPPPPVPPAPVSLGEAKPAASQRPGGGGPIPRPPIRPPHFQSQRQPSAAGSLRTGYQPQQPAERKSFKIGAWLMLGASVLLIGAVCYLGYVFFIRKTPAPAKPAAAVAAAPKPAPAPAAAAATPAAPPTGSVTPKAVEPGQSATHAQGPTTSRPVASTPPSASLSTDASASPTPIDRAQQVIAQHRAAEQSRIDLAVDPNATTDASGQIIPKEPLPAPEPSRQQGRATFSEISPGISATNHDIAATPQANSNFRRYVGDMVIRGVFQGAHPRAHINGRLVSQGEAVERNLGIIFDSIDADKKTITFRDASGATITRRY